jgi:hypothetical protein
VNTEIGAVIEVPESPNMWRKRIEQQTDAKLLSSRTRARHGREHNSTWINWVSEENGSTKRYKKEPNASFGRRFLVGLMALFADRKPIMNITSTYIP